MSDAVHVGQGFSPWRPSDDAVDVVELHRYDIPLAGVIEQHGVKYLYWCVTGHAAPDNAWAYAPVSDSAIKVLEDADSSSFDSALREAVGQHACAFAVASEDSGVIASVTLSAGATFDNVHERGMTELVERYQEMFNEYQLLQERFPLIRSAVNLGIRPTPQPSVAQEEAC